MNRRHFLQTGAAVLTAFAMPQLNARPSTVKPAQTAAMPVLTFHNGITMPLVGFGTWDVRGAEGQKAVENALEVGYRLFDTAAMYNNEEIVGAAIRASGIPRSEIFITSKIWSDMSYDGAKRTFEQSQRKLATDYVDLYLLHRPGGDIDSAWRALGEFHRQGRVKSLGVSNFNAQNITEFYRRVELKPVLNQIELNPFVQQTATRAAMRPLSIVTQSYSSLGGEGSVARVLKTPAIVRLAEKYGKTPAQIILRWLVQQNIAVIPKTMRRERMLENISLFDFVLDADDMRMMANLANDA